jgi:hypothetical protein
LLDFIAILFVVFCVGGLILLILLLSPIVFILRIARGRDVPPGAEDFRFQASPRTGREIFHVVTGRSV